MTSQRCGNSRNRGSLPDDPTDQLGGGFHWPLHFFTVFSALSSADVRWRRRYRICTDVRAIDTRSDRLPETGYRCGIIYAVKDTPPMLALRSLTLHFTCGEALMITAYRCRLVACRLFSPLSKYGIILAGKVFRQSFVFAINAFSSIQSKPQALHNAKHLSFRWLIMFLFVVEIRKPICLSFDAAALTRWRE